LAYLKYATLNATLAISLPYLAYGNGFARKSQPSAYFALVVVYQRQIYTRFLLFDIWSKFENLVYADEFQMNMPHDYISTCLPWRPPWWTRPTPPYLPWWVQHGHGGSALDINALPLDLVAKKLDWLEAELEILLWVWLLHSDMKHSKYWMTYLQACLHRSTLNTEGKNLTEAMCTKEWLQEAELSVNWVWYLILL
jgi:hypothetical protein